RAVHREQLVEPLRRHHIPVRERELQADDRRLQPTDEEPEQRRAEVQRGDALVIDGGQPAPELSFGVRFGAGVGRGGGGCCHASMSPGYSSKGLTMCCYFSAWRYATMSAIC